MQRFQGGRAGQMSGKTVRWGQGVGAEPSGRGGTDSAETSPRAHVPGAEQASGAPTNRGQRQNRGPDHIEPCRSLKGLQFFLFSRQKDTGTP